MTYEVDADGRDVGLGVGVVGEPQQQTRLSDTGVTDEEELEEIIVSGKDLVRVGRGNEVVLQIYGRRHDGDGCTWYMTL